jgi:hypothetical protein
MQLVKTVLVLYIYVTSKLYGWVPFLKGKPWPSQRETVTAGNSDLFKYEENSLRERIRWWWTLKLSVSPVVFPFSQSIHTVTTPYECNECSPITTAIQTHAGLTFLPGHLLSLLNFWYGVIKQPTTTDISLTFHNYRVIPHFTPY